MADTPPLRANSTVISIFAIVILGVLGLLFNAEHHELVGDTKDPKNGPAVAQTIFVTVLVYVVRSSRHRRASPRNKLDLKLASTQDEQRRWVMSKNESLMHRVV